MSFFTVLFSVLWNLVFRKSQVKGHRSDIQLDSLVSSGSQNPGCLSDAEETRFSSVISVSFLASQAHGFLHRYLPPSACDSAFSEHAVCKEKGQRSQAGWVLKDAWNCLKGFSKEQPS